MGQYQFTPATGLEASLTVSGGGTLYMGYELSGSAVNGAKVSNPSGFWAHSGNLLGDLGEYGVGAATNSSGKVFCTFTSTALTNNTEVVVRAASEILI
jgi:hypothetical protein